MEVHPKNCGCSECITNRWIDKAKQVQAENAKLKERIQELEDEIKGMERDINVRDSDIEDLKRDLSKP